MIIQLNPFKWGKQAAPPAPTFDDIHDLHQSQIAAINATQPQQEIPMSFKSILDKIGSDAKAVFSFLGSSKGQAIIATGEGLVETVEPGTAGVFALANNWIAEVVKTETLAFAAGAQQGSGAQKSAMVLAAVTPQALAFAKANGLSTPTATQLTAANNALVAFLNAFSEAPVTGA